MWEGETRALCAYASLVPHSITSMLQTILVYLHMCTPVIIFSVALRDLVGNSTHSWVTGYNNSEEEG